MPRSGAGVYSAPAGTLGVANTAIESAKYNAFVADAGQALTDSVNVAGTAPFTANQPMGGFKLTNLAAGSSDNDSVRLAQVVALIAAAIPATVVESIIIACSSETAVLTTGLAKVTFRMPYAFTLSDVRASVTTAPTGATLLTVDINESGTTILSTKLTFDAGEKTTTTATTARVISDTGLADDSEITIDIDAVGNTIAGAGLKVYLIGSRP